MKLSTVYAGNFLKGEKDHDPEVDYAVTVTTFCASRAQ